MSIKSYKKHLSTLNKNELDNELDSISHANLTVKEVKYKTMLILKNKRKNK